MSETAEEFLAHYGVQGMKWGKHKAKSDRSSGGSRKEQRQANNAKIHDARRAQAARLRKLQEAEGDFYVARTAKGQDKAEKIMRQREKDLFNNPDAETAAKLTSGEKWYVGVSYGLAAISVASMVAINSAANRR
ncbi:membrane protein [Arthrobacter phage Qui]|uniref:Membrane protein n=1 Tax=Arthrobacter phage Qui TaxID=2603260 RepID=A0A5B8WGA5_9CAUD|nr:membrane protein [Arthrobacter phage Qui]QED11513.1 membrane protein [Arthrobacter phage Qui]QOC56344.1 membrane protein [Arthrobacter phage Paella]